MSKAEEKLQQQKQVSLILGVGVVTLLIALIAFVIVYFVVLKPSSGGDACKTDEMCTKKTAIICDAGEECFDKNAAVCPTGEICAKADALCSAGHSCVADTAACCTSTQSCVEDTVERCSVTQSCVEDSVECCSTDETCFADDIVPCPAGNLCMDPTAGECDACDARPIGEYCVCSSRVFDVYYSLSVRIRSNRNANKYLHATGSTSYSPVMLVDNVVNATTFLLTAVPGQDTYFIHLAYGSHAGATQKPLFLLSRADNGVIGMIQTPQGGRSSEWQILRNNTNDHTLNGTVEFKNQVATATCFAEFTDDNTTTPMTCQGTRNKNGTKFFIEFVGAIGTHATDCAVSNPGV